MVYTSWYPSFLRQISVYWEPPIRDGLGGVTFSDPIQLASNWEERPVTTYGPDGTEITARSSVWVAVDVEIGGYLWLGEIEDIAGREVQDIAAQIVNFTKVWSLINKNEASRRAFLL